MNSTLGMPAAHRSSTSSRLCSACGGTVAMVASRKHRRLRCTVCELDVPLRPARPTASSDVENVPWDPARAEGRRRAPRPSPARGVARARFAPAA
jgi:hypothetical protein